MEKHRCRICSRCFQCGRSLGGHMRSHMRFYSIEAEKGKLAGEQSVFRAGYALRENPKHRKECSEEFPSSKALFGHMRCRSDKIISQRSQEVEQEHDQGHDQEEEEEGSMVWHKLFHDSMSYDNVPAAESRWNRRSILASTAIRSPSTTAYEQEQEDVAISLMMLSRDVSGCWASESSDKHSLALEEDELKQQSESGDFNCEYLKADDSGNEPRRKKSLNLAEFGKEKARIDEKGNCLNAHKSKLGRNKPKLESMYQCASCNRIFHSYQALGGHRASHKRIRSCCLHKSNARSDETETNVQQLTLDTKVSNPCQSNQSRTHECSICGKSFSSGQALGGHKRSHVVSNTNARRDNMVAAAEVKPPELLDLNFPAPLDEESSNTKPWRFNEGINHEQHLVDVISD